VKPLQTLAVFITLILALGVLSWALSKSSQVQKAALDTPPAAPENEAQPSEKPPEEPEKDYYSTNPFSKDPQAAQDAPRPKVEIEEVQYEFGRMALGKTGEHDFLVKNTGNAPLKLARGPVQCKCTVSGLKEREVPPGGETLIHLSWTPKDVGPFAQVATIWTNDPDKESFQIGANGEMYPEIIVAPENGWPLGQITNSNDVPLQGEIIPAVLEPFQITKVTPSSDRVKLEAVPFTEDELKERDLRTGFHLLGSLKGMKDPQSVTENVVIETSLKDHPKFELPVTGTRTGAITIIGPNWFAGGPLIDMGKIPTSKGKEFRLTLMVAPADEEMKFTDVSVDPNFVQVRLKPEQTGKELARERYTMFLNVPAGSPLGIWTASRPGKLTIKTNHPQVQELEINLHLEVE
jgi:hypothetical protein